jgi:hypothetical protein
MAAGGLNVRFGKPVYLTGERVQFDQKYDVPTEEMHVMAADAGRQNAVLSRSIRLSAVGFQPG